MKQCSCSLALRPSAALLLLLAMFVLSACGRDKSGPYGAAPTSPTVVPKVTPAVPSQAVSFLSEKGVMLQGVLYGQGTRAVILSNEGNNESGPWLPVAQQIAQQGYVVLTYGYRDQGNTINQLALHALTDLRAAIAFLRARAVTRLALVGASLGALVSVKEATVEKVDALVVISAPMGFQEVQLSDSELQRLKAPKLFVTSDNNDPFTQDTLHMYNATPDPKEKRVYPGTKHGLSLFEGDTGTDLLPSLLHFLRQFVPFTDV